MVFFIACNKNIMEKWYTRMHSSRMRTARAFTVCRSLLLRGGCTWSWGEGYLVPVGVPAWSRGVYLVPGGVPACSRGYTCLVPGGVPAWSWGVYLPGPLGVYLPGPRGCTCLVLGGVPGQVFPLWTE